MYRENNEPNDLPELLSIPESSRDTAQKPLDTWDENDTQEEDLRGWGHPPAK